jgi:phospho-N-acetylmuramoyl-pentapeptide-transferase
MTETSISLALSTLSFMLAVIWGGPLIRFMRYFKLGKLIRVEIQDVHITKMGTPTMGGLMFILPITLVTILINFAQILGFSGAVMGRSVLLPVLAMLAFAFLGIIDDWEGIRGSRRGIGMRGWTKFIIQCILAILIAYALRYLLDSPEMYWPGVKQAFSLGVFYIPIAAFIIVGASNIVNLTDGLDGLAGLISATSFAAYGGIAILQGQPFVARFCFIVVGALFGFLWFNVHPAELIMGDTGALSLGAAIGVIALMTGQWLLLPLIIIIPISEGISVLLQVGYFKITKGKRLFKRAPLHHHFELLGWSETQIVQRFWLVSLLFAMLGVALALV